MMGWIQHPLFLVTFFPLIGVIVIAFLKDEQRMAVRWTAFLTSAATFGLAIWILTLFNPNAQGIQLELDQPWLTIAGIPIGFHLGIDGLGLMMVLLTTFLTPLALLSSWQSIEDRVRLFMIFFLLLEVGLTGVFLALDLVLFYVFWEFTLVPMYFLIGIWGGERRIYATLKFFLYTFAGSVLMLLGILYIGLQAGTFSLPALIVARGSFAPAQTWLFLVFALAFAIKVPMWPLHSWLPDAHTEAPTAGSVILAGVMLKMGAYGFLRFNLPLFPQASTQFAPWIASLAVAGILYGAIVAYAQSDVKRLVAYSSVSHLGFVMLGVFSLNPEGISGAILQMVNHGLSTGALFLVVGFLYDRRHTRQFSAFGGVWKIVPVMGVLALIVTLSSMGLPGLNGFVGEFAILLGAFGSASLGSPWFVVVAALGVILAAVYLLFMFERVFLGPVTQEENRKLLDVNGREAFTLAALLVVIFWIGLYPKPFFTLIQPAAEHLAALAQATAVALH